jgi:hypothetical protein
MDQLKTYAVPLVALVILLVWFFVIRPMMSEQPPAEAEGQGQDEKAEPRPR